MNWWWIAQSWKEVEVIELEECGCVVIRGNVKKGKVRLVDTKKIRRFKTDSSYLSQGLVSTVAYPMGLSTPTSISKYICFLLSSLSS